MAGDDTPLPQLATELRDLVVTYTKQETLDPLRDLARWVAFGVAGSLLMGIGVVFLTLAGLRAIQESTGDTFDGNWTWVPYLIVTAALLAGAGVTWSARGAGRKERR